MRPLLAHQKTSVELAKFLDIEIKQQFDFTGLTNSTKNIQSGDLFVAVPGQKNHGASFSEIAKSLGAVAILTDIEGEKLAGNVLPVIVLPGIRSILGDLSAWFYSSPFRSIQSIGITGTNGKTTTASLLFQIWQFNNREAGMIGTVGISIGKDVYPSSFTTPESPELQSMVATMVERGVQSMVMEVSSHAIAQYRIRGAHFSTSAFTNLTQDHLDFHGTMENYFATKAKLFTFEYTDQAFVNIDNEYGRKLSGLAEVPVVTLSRRDVTANWYYSNIEAVLGGYEVAIRGVGGILIEGFLPLVGGHNLDNALMAIALAVDSGIDPLAISMVMQYLQGPAGRLEKVEVGQKFLALVDYAHTPDAVERVLSAVREITPGKIIAVLGCGGDRDSSKRPLMGASLHSGSDFSIFTSDNPRSEDPELILDQMTSGISLGDTAVREIDRRGAIAIAVAEAQEGDTVIVLGKGHEIGQEVAGVKHPFDDRIELARAIEELA